MYLSSLLQREAWKELKEGSEEDKVRRQASKPLGLMLNMANLEVSLISGSGKFHAT